MPYASKERQKEYNREYYRRYRVERLRAGLCRACGESREDLARTQCNRCRVHESAASKNRRAARKRRGQCMRCQAKTKRSYCDICRAAFTQSGKESLRRLRDEVLAAYGGQCACCSETERAFLTIDHIESVRRGAMDKPWKTMGPALCGELRRRGYPKGFQILCWNCNLAKHLLGQCPHQA